MKTFLSSTAVALALMALPALAWDGVDTETGGSVEIGKGNLVRTGQNIEIYDAEAGEYRDVTVESMQSNGASVEIEVYDNESGESHTLEMEE